MAAAPLAKYRLAMTAGSKVSASYSGRIHPADGLLRLISAMTDV